MIGFVGWLVLIGLIAGFLARLFVPGRDPMGCVATIVLGILGSFVGGFIAWALSGHHNGEHALQPSGIIGSIVGAIILLLIYRAIVKHRRRGIRQFF